MDALHTHLNQKNKCPRIVRRHKYERLTQNNQIWWNKKFKELEASVRVPRHKKFSELKSIFNSGELKSLQAAGLEYGNDEMDEYYKKKARKSTFRSSVYLPRRRTSLAVKRDVFIDRLIKFYQMTPEDAKVWSPKQKRIPDQSVHLIERATMVEEKLAEDFNNWFSSIKSYSKSEINKETILNIFEINTSLPIKKAVVINMQLMRSVPDQVAKYLSEPNLASSVVVKREIDSDIKASKIEPINIAFGKVLPPDIRKVKHTSDNKIKINSDHKELETFAAVFKDIMELETSRRFVCWLRNHPEVTPPPFLKKSYMKLKKKSPKKSLVIRQMYEAKVWTVDKHSASDSSEKQNFKSSLSASTSNESISEMNFLV